MDFLSTQNILVHIPIGTGGYDLSWIEAVGTLAGLLCIWLASLEKIMSTTSPWASAVQTLLKCTCKVKAFLQTRSPSFLTVKKNLQYWVMTKRLTLKTVVPYWFTKRIT